MKFDKFIDIGLLSIGTTYSIANIEQVLGVIILFVQLIWLLTKIIIKVYNNIKNKKTNIITKEECDSVDVVIDNIINKLEDKNEHTEK